MFGLWMFIHFSFALRFATIFICSHYRRRNPHLCHTHTHRDVIKTIWLQSQWKGIGLHLLLFFVYCAHSIHSHALHFKSRFVSTVYYTDTMPCTEHKDARASVVRSSVSVFSPKILQLQFTLNFMAIDMRWLNIWHRYHRIKVNRMQKPSFLAWHSVFIVSVIDGMFPFRRNMNGRVNACSRTICLLLLSIEV